jgi:hypothetical protein
VKSSEIIRLYGKYILFGLIIALVLIGVYRGCMISTLRDQYNLLRGQYDALKKASDAAMKEALVYIKAQDARIAEQTKLIEAKDIEIAARYRAIAGLQSSITVLEAEYATLTNKDVMIVNLRSQINIYKDKCLTFEGIIKDKNVIISSWIVKYVSEINISETWKKSYEDEHALLLVADQALSVQEKRLKSLSFGTNIKTIAIIAISGFIAYDLARGK